MHDNAQGILKLVKLDSSKSELWLEVLLLALKLGFTAFGGPAAHIAMLREEVVTRRGWLSNERFVDLLGAVNLIPGPNSTELVMHVGLERAGWRGWLAVTLELSRTAIVDVWTFTLTLLSGFLLVRYKLNSSYLMLAGVLLGLVVKR